MKKDASEYELLDPVDILAMAREMNDAFAKNGYNQVMTSALFDFHAHLLSEALYRRMKRWKNLDGSPAMNVPFEVEMQARALIASAWVSDIFLRKARDRSNSKMKLACSKWWNLMERTKTFVQKEVQSNRDYSAERAWKRVRNECKR